MDVKDNFIVCHFIFIRLPPPTSTLFPYTTLFRSRARRAADPAQAQPALRTGPRPMNVLVTTEHRFVRTPDGAFRSEEHTSELQSQFHLVCRLLLEKNK